MPSSRASPFDTGMQMLNFYSCLKAQEQQCVQLALQESELRRLKQAEAIRLAKITAVEQAKQDQRDRADAENRAIEEYKKKQAPNKAKKEDQSKENICIGEADIQSFGLRPNWPFAQGFQPTPTCGSAPACGPPLGYVEPILGYVSPPRAKAAPPCEAPVDCPPRPACGHVRRHGFIHECTTSLLCQAMPSAAAAERCGASPNCTVLPHCQPPPRCGERTRPKEPKCQNTTPVQRERYYYYNVSLCTLGSVEMHTDPSLRARELWL